MNLVNRNVFFKGLPGTVAMLALAWLAGGCGPLIGVRAIDDDSWFRRTSRSGLTGDEPSVYTALHLRQRGLTTWHERGRLEAIRTLQREIEQSRRRELSLALAETCYLDAKREPEASPQAVRMRVSSLLYAYAFLFDDSLGPLPHAFDPRTRLACDIYNRSLAKLVLHVRREGLPWNEPVELSSVLGPVRFEADFGAIAWKADAHTRLHTAYEFEALGVRNHFRRLGLGTPLLVVRDLSSGTVSPEDRFLSHRSPHVFAATMVVHCEQPLLSPPAGRPRVVHAQVLDPTRTEFVEFGGQTAPLEADTTTPLVYMFAQTPPVNPIEGLLNVPAWNEYRGLYMLQPYQRGKIPVVFIHGLLSTPTIWAEAANEILGDPELRSRYQIWWFQYPTGNPILYSAALLREALHEARHALDPDGTDAALDRMVLVGQSMGGLLAKLQTQTSGSVLWDMVSAKRVEELELPDEQKGLLRRVFVFEPAPFVRRVVFIVTPHRGSGIADRYFVRLFASTIRLPQEVSNTLMQLGAAVGAPLVPRTSLRDLSPTSEFLTRMSELPLAPGVTYHSIVADSLGPQRRGGSDLIVPYESAHFPQAVSEKVVHATHGTAAMSPLSVFEIRRILHEHAASGGEVARGAPQPAPRRKEPPSPAGRRRSGPEDAGADGTQPAGGLRS